MPKSPHLYEAARPLCDHALRAVGQALTTHSETHVEAERLSVHLSAVLSAYIAQRSGVCEGRLEGSDICAILNAGIAGAITSAAASVRVERDGAGETTFQSAERMLREIITHTVDRAVAIDQGLVDSLTVAEMNADGILGPQAFDVAAMLGGRA